MMIGIIVIIAGPLLLFSTANPVATLNPVLGGSMKFMIKIQPNDTSKPPNYYGLITNNEVYQIVDFPDSLYNYYNFSMNSLTRNFDKSIIQILVENKYSQTNWEITPPMLSSLRTSLEKVKNSPTDPNNPIISFMFYYTFA